MSALVILECNACSAISPPWATADRAREEAAPDGWAVDIDGSNVDYCPKCTAPADPVAKALAEDSYPELPRGPLVHAGRLTAARIGVEQLRDAFAAIALAHDATPTAMVSVANLARVRADQLLAELAA